jgi:hypothetical protein
MKKTARSFSMLGLLALLPALSLSLGTAGCGGSEASPPPRDGAVGDAAGTGGTAGTPGAGGAGGTGAGGVTSTGGAGVGGAGAGGVGAGGAGGSIGGGGGTSQGGAGGSDAGPAPTDTAADKPVFSFDALGPDGLTFGDGGPTVIQCPADYATATCTTGVICVKGTGPAEGCGCTQMQRWFCPGIIIGGDGGVGTFDGGSRPDVAGVQACPTGTATGVTCSSEGALCTGVGTFGCACTTALGSLRWLCY